MMEQLKNIGEKYIFPETYIFYNKDCEKLIADYLK
jgi:hypothetical protein